MCIEKIPLKRSVQYSFLVAPKKVSHMAMAKPIIYGVILSPPVRTVLLTCKALNLDYEFRVVDLLANEHNSEKFLKMNPQHTVPVLEDDGKYLSDSHAICTYLVGKYGEDNSSFYPKDLYDRALVDQRLFFEAGLFTSLRAITIPLLFQRRIDITDEKLEAISSGYAFLEKFLENHSYLAGNNVTLADFSAISTVTSLEAFLPVESAKYPNVADWMHRLTELPYYEEANNVGAKALIQHINDTIAELQTNN